MELQVGKTYRVDHIRKGTFDLRVTGYTPGGEWVDGVLVNGDPHMANPRNRLRLGEEMTIRSSFATFTLIQGDQP